MQFLYESDLITRGQVLVGLFGADLSEAILRESYLNYADLSAANLSGANLSAADLSGANLRGAAGITNEELEQQADSLEGATMPDGSIHD